MRKICITFLLLFIIFLTVGCSGLSSNGHANTEFLRIHIRANSNTDEDQSVKYIIKDLTVRLLTPYISNCHSKDDAAAVIEKKSVDLKYIIDIALRERGFNYSSKVSVKNEKFPSRVYEGVSLEGGYYDAVIVELGEAKGDNWWCVVYPPLCFSGSENVTYKSKILEIIAEFKERQKTEG